MATTPLTQPPPALTLVDGIPTCLSTDVAQNFNKGHNDVLKAIRNLLEDLPADRLRNFAQTVVERPNPSGGAPISAPAYRLTRDGFTVLAMGFRGKEAMDFKWAYLDAFNKMEAELSARMAPKPTRQVAYAQARWFLKLCTWAASMQRAALARAVDIHPSTLSRVLHGSGAYGRGCIPTHIATKVDAALLDFCPMTPEVLPQFKALSAHDPAQRPRQLSLI